MQVGLEYVASARVPEIVPQSRYAVRQASVDWMWLGEAIRQCGQGTFELDAPEEREFPNPIKMTTEGLLMEAMRQLDEVRRLGPDMPDLGATISLNMPLIPPLRDLDPEELDVLQIAYNYGHVETVLNKSLASDLETSEILVKLMKAGYLKAE